MKDKLKHEVVTLAHARSIEAECKAEIDTAQTFLEASYAWKNLGWRRELLKTAKDHVAIAEAATRKQALSIYEETGDKAPHPAVPIKMYTVLDYEPADALDYAREHLPKALKLVKRTFEKAARVLELDFVDFTQEPHATIARDLSKYLPED